MSKVVLLVEDDEDNRDLVSFVIARSRMDVELVLAENGQEAIDKAFARPPQLILMDMQMPVMDGYEATRRIKATAQGQATVIIAITASAFENNAGASGLLVWKACSASAESFANGAAGKP